ncbi:MAG TPA: GNAT family N-acetyltransferase [Oscillospiraceae bacterium]|nr:GNAT family N-acetyltransferase [Oscillospiraceae bacterium]HPF56781.1 GNAT family N-acetyltransferase [Clostridiales bacterium]HPK35387.1 GNAT family N-acetyltransferase [Oscillospiraceae bacterium]HPR75320.1 GNAT family N-acetyltransferase [Oscillospiraceae bacterium]
MGESEFFSPIETKRLMLKNISADDRAFILKQFSDDSVNRYLYDTEPFSNLEEADELIDYFTQPEPRTLHRWILVLKDGGEKIGTCGFHNWDRRNQRAEIGYDLQPDFWGKGYMSEALEAILVFARDRMKLKRIDAHIYPENLGSVRLAERHGFRFCGETKVYVFRGKEYLHRIYTLYME